MSEADTKTLIVNIKDLSFKSEQIVVDLIRFIAEALPQIEITRVGNELTIIAPIKLSKRTIRLRIKKFLYRKGLSAEYRPIKLMDPEKEGYVIKEKRVIELSYY